MSDVPDWVAKEVALRQAKALHSYRCLPNIVREMIPEADYIQRYMETKFKPLTWADTGTTQDSA